MNLALFGLEGLPEIQPGDDLAALIQPLAQWQAGDILVVTQKIVSKAEGRLVRLADVEPRPEAEAFARQWARDPRQVELVLRESVRIVRMEAGLIISETVHGFVCANAGVDVSNAGGEDVACLLPVDADASARRLHEALKIPVIISDTFGRPWRNGITNVAIGVAGLKPLVDYRGMFDPHGYELKATWVAVADEIACAAELVMGKTARCPVAVLRGYTDAAGDGNVKELIMPAERDLFK